ncbi:MAG: hypothetical protein AAFO01_09315 [Pseudomonadota bacterium]
MALMSKSIYKGPNIYAPCPVVLFTLDASDLRSISSPESSFISHLLDALPRSLKQSATCGVRDASRLGHLFEHICIDLQNLAGAEVRCVRNHCTGQLEQADAIVPFENEDVCIEAGRWAEDFIMTVFRAGEAEESPISSIAGTNSEDSSFESRLHDFLVYAGQRMLPVQDRALIRTAQSRGIPSMQLAGRMIVLGQGRFQQRLSATKTTRTNVVSNDLAANKDYTRRVLGDLGLPIPRYKRVRSRRDALDASDSIGYPVVLKPNNGSMGEGVSIGMKGQRDVKAAYRRAREFGRSILVEEMIGGSDYRLLVIDGKFCAASKRVPGHVVGDDKHTIEELVTELNSDPRRGSGPTTSWTVIELDAQADRLIADLGYTRESIPTKGEIVYLRRNANTSDGGTAVDVTDDVHPDNRDIAVRAAKAIGLDIAGVDFLTHDISISMWENGGKICEINSRPGIRKHIWPAEGKPRDVLTPIINMLFPANRPSRVPVIAVIGTGDICMTAQMIAYALTANGYHVGLALQHRVYSGGRMTAPDPMTDNEATRRILLDPDVDAAVLTLSADEVLSHGLGCDAFDVVIIQNARVGKAGTNTGDPAEAQTSDLVVDTFARATHGMILVDEADTNVARLDQAGDDVSLCRISTEDRDWRSTITSSRRGTRALCEGSSVCIYHDGEPSIRIPMVDISTGFSESDKKRIEETLLFASVAVYELGSDPSDIYRSLSSFCSALFVGSEERSVNEVAGAQS